MYKYLLQSLDGIQLYGIVTLVLFFSVFCIAAIRAILADKQDTDRLARMPLDEEA